MSELKQIPLVDIETHWELNRKPNDSHVFGLAGHMNENGYNKAYPLRVVVVDDVKHLAAGHHRYAAAQLTDILFPNLPLPEVWAEVVEGTMEDVFRILHEDNFKHDPGVNPAVGLPLSRAEKAAQCQALLHFPDVFKKSNRALGAEWGVHHSTVADWRKAVSVGIRQMAAANLDAETLLSDFSITPERLAAMLELIESGEREVTRDGKTFTQKTVDSEERRRAEREMAIADFRTMADRVNARLDSITTSYPHLKRSTLHRRLYQAFGLTHAGNASRWPTPKVKEEAEILQQLVSALDPDNRDALWLREFRNINTVREVAGTLIDMGPPYEKPEIQNFLERVNHIPSADWESLDIDARRGYLQNIAWNAHSLPTAEQKLRDGKEAKAAAAAKAASLDTARADAAAACTRLVAAWHASPCEDKTQDGYRQFVIAACDMGNYSSDRLFPAEFIKPRELPNPEACQRIQDIADRICQDVASKEPPYWILRFFPQEVPEDAEEADDGYPPEVEGIVPAAEPAMHHNAVADACLRLKEGFLASAIVDKSDEGYREFITAACLERTYSTMHLLPKSFIAVEAPGMVNTSTEYGREVQSVAITLLAELESEPHPAWMYPFMELETAPSAEVHEASESDSSLTEEKAEPALNHNAVRTIRDAVNAIGSVLPLEVRAMPSLVAVVEQQVAQLAENPVERLDILRAVFQQTLKQL